MKTVLLRQILSLLKPLPIIIVICFLLFPVYLGLQTDPESNTLAEMAMMGLMLSFMGSIVSLSALTIDEKNGWEKFMVTMPISKKQISTGNLLFAFLVDTVVVLVSTIPAILLMVRTIGFDFKEWLFVFSCLLFAAVFLTSLVSPVYIRFGSVPGLAVYIIIFMTILIGGVIILKQMSLIESGTKAIVGITNADKYGLSAALIGGCAVFVVLSMIVSAALYKKKEF